MFARLIYVSTPVLSPSGVTLREIVDSIRDQALLHNSNRHLTGALAYCDTRFAQVLEGPADEVQALIQSIAQDQRHTDFRIVDNRLVQNRAFSDWAMAFFPMPELGDLELTPRALVRALVDAAQRRDTVRAIPGQADLGPLFRRG